MSGMTVDPDKCFSAKARLGFQAVFVGLGTSGLLSEKGIALFHKARGSDVGVFSQLNYLYNYPEAVRNVWNDCDLGGGLKRKLSQFKAKASEVVGSFVPQPVPVLVGARLEALDLPIEVGRRNVAVSGDPLRMPGTGEIDKATAVVVGGAVIFACPLLAPVTGLEEIPIFASVAAL